MRALIVGQPYNPSVLAAVRQLGRSGWFTGIGTPTPNSLAYASRFGCREHIIPQPEVDLNGFVRGVNEAEADAGYEVVFAAGDAELMALSYARDDIATHVPYGSLDTVTTALDKLSLAQVASTVGIRSPHTVEATEATLATTEEHLLVKSRLHWHPHAGASTPRLEASIPSSSDERHQRVREILLAGGSPVLQERITGSLMSFTTLYSDQLGLVATCQHISTHVWPPGTGMPTRSFSIPIDNQLAEKVRLLLQALRWSGLVNLQFIVPKTGSPYLIDFNGRFYFTMALAYNAGVNFADLAGRLATGREVGPPVAGEVGRRYCWLGADVKRAFVERQGGLARDLLSGAGYAMGAVGPIHASDDRRPTIKYLRHRYRTMVKRVVAESRLRTSERRVDVESTDRVVSRVRFRRPQQ